LLNQTLALGVVSRKVEHRDLECTPLFEDKIILIVPAPHPWAKYGRALPADLVEQPFIRREDSSGTCEAVFEALKHFGISGDDMNVVMELGNAEAIEMAVEEGIGIAFVSELVAARGLALGKVRQVEIEGLNVSQTVYLCRQMASIFTRAEARFWEFTQSNRQNLSGNLLTNLGDLSHAPNIALK